MLSPQQFAALAAEGYNRIPLVRELLADLETPLSTYMKLANRPYSYLLESVRGGEKWGRYSIIGLPCRRRIEVSGFQLTEYLDGEPVHSVESRDPLAEIRRIKARFRVPELPGLPRFNGGLVGYFGYDTVRYIEPRLGINPNPDPVGAPDILLLISEELVVFDNLAGRLYVVVHVDPADDDALAQGRLRLDAIAARLGQGLEQDGHTGCQSPVPEPESASAFPRPQFEAAVDKCKRYIFDGDAFQIVMSLRLSLPYAGRPLDLYRALRTLNPSPYLYYLNMGPFQIAGSSPEILVRLEDGEVTLRPIAGTRRRGRDEQEDAQLAQELLADPKELAEHLMLIDLGRNDVGRVSRIGSVRVTDKMTIEKYSHVMHIVSNVSGQINEGLDAIDVLRATFPAGTLSGAPKIRALEIIEELEPDKRGIYSGAVGYIGWNGNMDTAIAIRTALIKEQTVYVQAGAGIVADSVPALEWEEAMNKGRVIFRAVEMVHNDLHSPLDKAD